ncbi:MAG TPA: hypothetical protein PKC43_13810 [Phycisphaerales bacterium]|nr:hypothetical protein [Phycisphaerales bacterium]HMP38509.1 hypothetical protein [Phycisphaerales bacterium]
MSTAPSPRSAVRRGSRRSELKCLALLVAIGGLLDPGARSADATTLHVRRPGLLIGGHPITPPPSPKLLPYLPQFWTLLAAYSAAAVDDRTLPFSLWLIASGIVDPVEHHAMMALHAWWSDSIRRQAFQGSLAPPRR